MISIDPGVHGCGWARWNALGLVACGYGKPPIFTEEAIVELPMVYPGSKGKGNPNDLIRLAFAAGQAVNPDFQAIRTVLPRQWKGTIKKEVMLKRILTKLDTFELSLLKGLGLPPSKEHNVVDSVGIGLWALGRLK